jgi:transcriptional regulator with XRE-family HTH domain
VDIAARFGANVARCRKRANLSQEEVSIRASLHRTEISQIERGLRLARVDTLVKLSGALGVSPSELVEGIDWRPGRATLGEFSVESEGEPARPGRT